MAQVFSEGIEFNKSTVRQLLPDVLKGVAVLLMIQVHLMELFATQELYDSLVGKIALFLGGPPAAPVFMAVMGFFIAKSGSGILKLVTRGLKLILYGFLLNTGLNLHLFYHVFTGEMDIDPLPYLFGVDILFLAGLSIIIIALLRLALRKNLFLWLTVTLIVAFASSLIPTGDVDPNWKTYLLAYFYKASWWSYFPLFPWLAYPLAGYCFKLVSDKYYSVEFSRLKLAVTASLLLIPLLAFFSYGFNITTDLPAYYHHSVSYFLWALLFLGVWTILFQLLINTLPSNPVITYLQWTGRNVTAFYVFQWLIIGNLATAFYKSMNQGSLVLWFMLIVLATSLLVLAYIRLKKLKPDNKLR